MPIWRSQQSERSEQMIKDMTIRVPSQDSFITNTGNLFRAVLHYD